MPPTDLDDPAVLNDYIQKLQRKYEEENKVKFRDFLELAWFAVAVFVVFYLAFHWV